MGLILNMKFMLHHLKVILYNGFVSEYGSKHSVEEILHYNLFSYWKGAVVLCLGAAVVEAASFGLLKRRLRVRTKIVLSLSI